MNCPLLPYYPLELMEQTLDDLFRPHLASKNTDVHELSNHHLLMEQLFVSLKRCLINPFAPSLLFSEGRSEINTSVIDLFTKLIPCSYLFLLSEEKNSQQLLLVTHPRQYLPSAQIQELLHFLLSTQENLRCIHLDFTHLYQLLVQGHFFYSGVCQPSRLLYKHENAPALPMTGSQKIHELISKASEDYQHYQGKAFRFLSGATYYQQINELPLTAFMLQQACEFSLRSLFIVLNGKDQKGHDLSLLIQKIRFYTSGLEGFFDRPRKEKKLLSELQSAYTETRYNRSFHISLPTVKELLSFTHCLIEKINALFLIHRMKLLEACTS